MSDTKNKIEEIISTLKQQRDELDLQMHLGAAEAKEEFDEAMQKLNKMGRDFEPVKDATEESAENVYASLKLVGEEVKASFNRVKNSF
jgi:hypothetical protein